MKKLFKVALVAICILSMGSFANAQQKIGYVNFDQVVQLMPELKTVRVQMDAFQKPLMESMTGLQKEHDDKIKAFQAKQATMTESQRSLAGAEITDLEKRMQDFQTKAQQDVEAKTNEYLKPITDKVRAAITAVAKEKGFTYVINSAQTELLVSPETDDLLNAVKAKLNLTGATPAVIAPIK